MEEFAFNLFCEVDKLFDTKYVNTSKFYNDKKVTQYCPNKDGYTSCYSDYQRINAIGTYVFMELIGKNQKLNGMDDERHLSYFIMWISHILYRRFEDNTFTLNSIYEKHLKNNFGNFNYWKLLHNKMYLTNSKIAIMNVLYLLFQQICDTINTIQTKDIQPHEYTSKALEFYVIYNKIFKHINPCGPYRELLNHLKTTYNKFIKIAKNKNANSEDVLNMLIELSPTEKNFGDKFSSKGCIKIHKKLNDNTSKLIKIGNNMLKDYAEKKIQNTPDLIKSQDTKFYYYYGFDDNDVNGGDGFNGGDDVNSGDDAIDDDDDENGDLRNNGITINSSNQEQNGQQGTSIVSKPASEKSPPTPPQAPQKPGASPQSGTNDSSTQKGNSDSEGGEKGDPDSGAPSLQGDQGGSPGGSGSQGDSSNQGGSDDGSKPSGDQVPTHPSGASSGHLPSIWGMNFNPMSYIPSVSGMYESSKTILTNTANQISDAYTNTVGIVKGAYDKTVTTVKNAYTTSTNYIGGAVTSITDQLSSFGTFQLSDDQSGSNSLGGGVDTSDQSQQNPKQPENPPPSLPPSSPQPQSNQIQDPPQTPSDPSSPKSIDSQTSSTPIQQIAPTDGNRVSQIPLSAQGTLPSSITDPSTQWNGSITRIVAKMNEKPSIWCIGSNNKCGITGISIIVISISIVLTIMYKYLSLGCTSKSKRKKSVKKVINSIGGKRPIQIIIKSYDRNKDLKPVINSVGRKKDPLLNIYKLMKADPIPFINVFFLLIFFVYKRQLNYLEL
ncbi:CIR protein PIR protein [Plasmodium vinckei petteri]|uniref:CIR protein PIR protein n=1 Tax=Plasmodium vinckei petteri TaxID=138298 RepID=A0A6V7TB83_PLAVN|nr:CIR protein PIR protein [Plasmodium vinckei petteri]CAD2110740.1 CIR protein PIR protein [Plasmodium vinckei petteri]